MSAKRRQTVCVDFDGAEVWLPVRGFPYDVSSHGRVRRTAGGSNNAKPGRILKGALDRDGYVKVRLCVGGVIYDRAVHRLVCEAFHGSSTLPEVRHLDGCRTHNHAANLRWGTAAENAADRDRHGRTRRGGDSPRARFSSAQARSLRLEYRMERDRRVALGYVRVSRGWRIETAARYGVSVNTMANVLSGKGYAEV